MPDLPEAGAKAAPAPRGSLTPAARTTPYLAIVVTIITWGSAFAGIRAGLHGYSPAHLALLRFAIASLGLGVLAAVTRMPRPQRQDLPMIAILGLVGFVIYNLALNYGQVTIPAATASLLVATAPIWIALLASLLFHERLCPMGWAGIGLAFGGVAVISLGGNGSLHLEARALAILVAALASCTYSLGQKRLLERYSALQVTAYAVWAGTLFLLPFGAGLVGEIAKAPLPATLAVAYLGLVPGALGYATWAYTLACLPAAAAGSFLYLVPVSATVVAWLWLGEVPGLLTLLGGALVLGGVVVVNRWGREPVAGPAAPPDPGAGPRCTASHHQHGQGGNPPSP